ITMQRLIDFLILDEAFPRAIHYCLKYADISLNAILGAPIPPRTANVATQVGNLRAALAMGYVDAIVQRGLHEFIDGLQSELNAIHHTIHQAFFCLDDPEPPGAR
ncbi:MAG TPA: alpha-E domain-containing protein, partial [Pirellulaceae bacterium]